jgi:hypothetical protein
VHLVGFAIGIYYDAQTYERQISGYLRGVTEHSALLGCYAALGSRRDP